MFDQSIRFGLAGLASKEFSREESYFYDHFWNGKIVDQYCCTVLEKKIRFLLNFIKLLLYSTVRNRLYRMSVSSPHSLALPQPTRLRADICVSWENINFP